MNSNSMAMRIYAGVLAVGDVVGKLLAFLTLPATLFTGYVYFDEIRDFFSKPDLTTEIQFATLRCNYVWRDPAAYQKYQRGDVSQLINLCNASPVAVSFEFSVTNNDSIARELKSLSITADAPPYGNRILQEVQSVEHLIQHGAETNLRRDWRVQVLEPGATAIFEILAFGSKVRSDEIKWRRLSDAMDAQDPNLLNSIAKIELNARVSGYFNETQNLLTCSLALDAKEFQQWQDKRPHERIQITNECK